MTQGTGRRAANIAVAAVILVGGAITLAACNPLPPCSRTWTGATSTDFGTPSNWVENAVPGPSDHVCAAAGSTIVVTGNFTVESVFLDGTVTIPVGSSLSNVSPSLQTISIIDTLVLNGTIGGDAPLAVRGATINGTVSGSSFFADLGVKPSTLTSLRVLGDKKAMATSSFTWTGNVHLCDNGIFGVAGAVTLSTAVTVDTAGCATVTNPQFGVSDTGTLNVNANLNASAVNVGNLGILNIGPGATLATGTMTQYAGYNGTTTVGSGAFLTVGSGGFALNAGTLTGTGTVTSDVTGAGKVVPGTANGGALTIYGGYVPAAGGQVQYGLTGTTPGVGFAQFVVGSGADLTNGSVSATALPGFAPATGAALPLLVAAGVSGTFTSATLPAVAGHGVTIGYTPTEVDLQVTDCNPAVYFPNATLTGLNLSGMDLRGCDLSGANLFTSNLTGTKLNGANLTGARLGFANLTNATVTGANFTNAINVGGSIASTLANGWSHTNFSGTGINLSGQNLASVGTQMDSVNLTGTNLSGTTLTGVNLNGAVLHSTNLSTANLTGADIGSVDLGLANLTSTNLSDAPGLPAVSLPATYSNTTCPTHVSSDANGGNCEGQWNTGGGGGGVGATAAVIPTRHR